MLNKIKKLARNNQEIVKYIIFGVLTTAVNYIVFFTLISVYSGMNTVIANTIAWIISFLFAFFTNRKWVFKSKAAGFKERLMEFWWFLVARIFSLVIDDTIIYLGIDMLHQNQLLIKLISQIVIVLINYIFSKWIFHRN